MQPLHQMTSSIDHYLDPGQQTRISARVSVLWHTFASLTSCASAYVPQGGHLKLDTFGTASVKS